jgi:hypothetical protein
MRLTQKSSTVFLLQHYVIQVYIFFLFELKAFIEQNHTVYM